MTLDRSKSVRGRRIVEIQAAIFSNGDTEKDSNIAALAALRRIAARYGLPVKWDNSRLSKIRNGTQGITLEDVASFVLLAREYDVPATYRDWFFVAYGEPFPEGQLETTEPPENPANRLPRREVHERPADEVAASMTRGKARRGGRRKRAS